MTLTPSELVVLGLVVEKPRHGYDLERVIDSRGIREWTDVGFSSIYYLLTKLEKRGLIAGTAQPRGAKSRRTFKATAAGREAAGRATLDLIAIPQRVHHPVLVALANLPLLTEQEYAAALHSRIVQIETRLASIRSAEQAQEPLPMPAREVFSYSLTLLEAERAWLVARARDGDR